MCRCNFVFHYRSFDFIVYECRGTLTKDDFCMTCVTPCRQTFLHDGSAIYSIEQGGSFFLNVGPSIGSRGHLCQKFDTFICVSIRSRMMKFSEPLKRAIFSIINNFKGF